MGVKPFTIQRYEAETIDNTKQMVLDELSEALHISVEWLKGKNDEYRTDITDIIRIYSKKPEVVAQRFANILSEQSEWYRYHTLSGCMF